MKQLDIQHMTAVNPTANALEAHNGLLLRARMQRSERKRTLRAVGLIMPLFLFLLVTFVIPIAEMLFRSIQSPEIAEILPNLAAVVETWDGQDLPPDEVLSVFAGDVIAAKENRTIARAAKRLNNIIPGYRGLLLKTARQMPTPNDPLLLEKLIQFDKRWGERRYWVAIKQASPSYTLHYLLASVDREYDVDGSIVHVPPENSIYLTLLRRTLWISFVVTGLCLLLGYPIAHLLANLPTKYSNLLLLLLLLPFWTSLLVRTTAWLVLLQNEGVVNDIGIFLGLWDEPLQLVRNRAGVYIAMTHILLPFMVLPIFSVMKGISPYHLKAAASLGARPFRSFIKVYAPQTIPGVGAGVLLVFIMSLGYYITPALVGGPKDQMLSYFIAFNANTTVNWGMAAALSVLLMVCVGIFFAMYNRFVGVEKLRIG